LAYVEGCDGSLLEIEKRAAGEFFVWPEMKKIAAAVLVPAAAPYTEAEAARAFRQQLLQLGLRHRLVSIKALKGRKW
jgi:hypothetical protein